MVGSVAVGSDVLTGKCCGFVWGSVGRGLVLSYPHISARYICYCLAQATHAAQFVQHACVL